MTDDERAKYAGLISLRNTEVTLRWTRTQLFLVLNSVGLPLVITQQFQHHPGPWFRITGGSVGLALTAFWFFATRRASEWTRFWEARLIFLEEQSQDTTFRVFGAEEFVRVRWDGPVMDQVLFGLNYVFAGLWVVVIASPLFWS